MNLQVTVPLLSMRGQYLHLVLVQVLRLFVVGTRVVRDGDKAVIGALFRVISPVD